MIGNDHLNDSLAPDLAERTRRLGRGDVASNGEYVLYWMRTAIRADENQALLVAIQFANRLGLPLLVYQGLSKRSPLAILHRCSQFFQNLVDQVTDRMDACVECQIGIGR